MRAADVPVVAEAGVRYVGFRAGPARRAVAPLLAASPGRGQLSGPERRLATVVDRGLGRVGARCLARAVVVTQMLRRRGVAARVVLSVDAHDPRQAHAEVEVGGTRLRPLEPGHVPLG